VAKLAGLPPEVVERARRILASLEGSGGGDRDGRSESGRGGPAVGPRPVAPGQGQGPQLGLFGAHRPQVETAAPAPSAPGRGLESAGQAALRELAAALRAVDPDELSPRAAWDLLAAWRKKLTTSDREGPS
jgi:DNA mismatch repair ATPase MutS